MLTLINIRQVAFYKTAQGIAPVEAFLNALSAKQAAKVTWVLRLIEQLPRVPKQYLKKLVGTDELWEVRVQVGSDIFRILGFFVQDATFVATHGFQKKSMAVPKADISLAQKRKKDYLKKYQ